MREETFVTHLLRGVATERGAEATAAMHDDLRILVGIKFLQIAFQNPFAEMHRFGGVAGVPFVIFADVQGMACGLTASRARASATLISVTRFLASLTRARNPGE